MKYLRLLLFPFSLVYWLVTAMRNLLYDKGIFKRTAFKIPTIVVGNLTVGGTGKSPMTEYLIRLLAANHKVATLSRGYGRKTRGYIEVSVGAKASEVGDEPLQFKRKFPNITVAVCESRVEGVSKLQADHDVVLLDDAFQHRALDPTMRMLLFDFQKILDEPKLVLPAGNYRESFSGRKRADVIIVTKTPADASAHDKHKLRETLSVGGTIPVLFTTIAYGSETPLFGSDEPFEADEALLLTGIANPKPLQEYLRERLDSVSHIAFGDHHAFTERDIARILNEFDTLKGDSKAILTTEKDAMRLAVFAGKLEKLPVFFIPIKVSFLDSEEESDFQKRMLAVMK